MWEVTLEISVDQSLTPEFSSANRLTSEWFAKRQYRSFSVAVENPPTAPHCLASILLATAERGVQNIPNKDKKFG